VIVNASHGGIYAAYLAAKLQAAAAVFSDAAVGRDNAGIGKDDVGVARLPALDARNIAAATVSAASARIG
jgi:hypothetical protein